MLIVCISKILKNWHINQVMDKKYFNFSILCKGIKQRF